MDANSQFGVRTNKSKRLVRNGIDVCDVTIADTFWTRLRGLLGKSAEDAPLLLRRTTSVHSIGMTFAIEVAFIDVDGIVIDTTLLVPNRLCRRRPRTHSVLEAIPGSFEEWSLDVGSHVAVT